MRAGAGQVIAALKHAEEHGSAFATILCNSSAARPTVDISRIDECLFSPHGYKSQGIVGMRCALSFPAGASEANLAPAQAAAAVVAPDGGGECDAGPAACLFTDRD
jgi:hypothetical protein